MLQILEVNCTNGSSVTRQMRAEEETTHKKSQADFQALEQAAAERETARLAAIETLKREARGNSGLTALAHLLGVSVDPVTSNKPN